MTRIHIKQIKQEQLMQLKIEIMWKSKEVHLKILMFLSQVEIIRFFFTCK